MNYSPHRAMISPMTPYGKENPFLATLVERTSLAKNCEGKHTQSLVLDIKGSGFTYTEGDSVAIYPENCPNEVELVLSHLNASGCEPIVDKRSLKTLPLQKFLSKNASISKISRKLASLLGVNDEELKEFVETRHLWDALKERGTAGLSLQELSDLLMPLQPRFYSIASSYGSVGDEVHLTVAHFHYDSNNLPRRGVCTHWLCTLLPLFKAEVPLYIHPSSDFRLPEDPATPIIMIGPGTGVAPFRAFMQKRRTQHGAFRNWLFFGEWHEKKTFFYESFWKELEREGHLKLDVAFSRDQADKVYVQHKMEALGGEFWAWLEEGAVVYVCGDASRMAKDVDKALHEIVAVHGGLGPDGAKEYVRSLRKSGRYLRDVY